jgi:uncharacterized SAM-binding protein YcdF (DUF218 family)
MKRVIRLFRFVFVTIGLIALCLVILAFTSAPFWTWYSLSTKKAAIHRPPEYIVLLGGGGMPSESGLIRCWYAAKAANYFTRAKVIVALPGDTSDRNSSINGMKMELILRGISPERILVEDSGTNTRSQALNIRKQITIYDLRVTNKNNNSSIVTSHSSLLIVTSPEHLYRAVLTFEKTGFLRVDGLPAFESAIESDITFNARKLGGRKLIPDVGESIALRYQFWSQLHYELLVLHEWLAIAYYRVQGWI